MVELVVLVTTAAVPLNRTVLLAAFVSNPVPVMVTTVLAGPLDGEMLVMVGIIEKFVDDIAVWLSPFTVTLIGPVVAPNGTAVTISVFVALVTTVGVPLNATVSFVVTGLKFVPMIVTAVPTVPPDGEKLMMLGDVLFPHPDKMSKKSNVAMAMHRRNPDDVYIVRVLSKGVACPLQPADFTAFATNGRGRPGRGGGNVAADNDFPPPKKNDPVYGGTFKRN